MAIKYSNNAKTTLASAINSTETSITVADASVFPALGAGDTMYLTLSDAANQITEIILCTGITGNVLTVQREYENTTALDWNAGDTVSSRLTADMLDTLLSSAGDPWTLSADTVSFTYTAEGAIDVISEDIGTDTRTTTVNYDAEGIITSVVVVFLGVQRTETFTYNAEGSIESISISEVSV